jgi:hypothetical protein
MIYSAALEMIAKMDNGVELLDAIKAEVNDKGKENKSLRDRLKTFGDKDASAVNAVFKALEAMDIDVTGNIPEQLEALEKNTEKKVGSDYDKKIAGLTKAVEGLQKSLSDEQAQKAQLAKENRTKTIESSLSSAFGARVLNPSVTLKYHLANGDFDINDAGKIIYKAKDGTEALIDNGNIDSFLKDYPDAVKNVQKPGSESAPATDKGGQPLKFTIEQVKKMSSQEVAANYDAVKAVMAAQPKT